MRLFANFLILLGGLSFFALLSRALYGLVFAENPARAALVEPWWADDLGLMAIAATVLLIGVFVTLITNRG
jgi:hypothetical protein